MGSLSDRFGRKKVLVPALVMFSLLSGFSGGAALNMGDPYLMESVAVVVLGGASISGVIRCGAL